MVAPDRGADLLNSGHPADHRSRQQARVLGLVLGLNLAVAGAKVGFGFWSGTVSILSDGIHSVADSVSNVVALVGVRAARAPADASHPYGHRKFETLATVGILVFLLVALVQIVETAIARLMAPQPIDVTGMSFGVMAATLLVNLVVVRYEASAGRRLQSEVLLADAHHTRSDVYTSLAVIAGLAGVSAGWVWFDPAVALLVAVFIGRAVYQIARQASDVLADRAVLPEGPIHATVMTVPEVIGCHQIRTRGSADHTFLDLHVWFPADMPLVEAHRLSHVVKDRLMETFPTLQDVVIHIEPK